MEMLIIRGQIIQDSSIIIKLQQLIEKRKYMVAFRFVKEDEWDNIIAVLRYRLRGIIASNGEYDQPMKGIPAATETRRMKIQNIW